MRLAALVLLVALPAGAEPFRSQAPITPTGRDALQRLEVPAEVYRDARRDLGDVRIVNGKGEAVPMAWASEAPAAKDAAATIALPAFPVSHPSVETTQLTVRVKDGAVEAIQRRDAPIAPPRPVAYVLDASAATAPLQALLLDWESGPGTQMVTVGLEASDDLKSWAPLAHAPVVKVQAEGRTLAQPRVEFPPRRVKYLRLTWNTLDFRLEGARAELESAVRPAPRKVQVVKALPDSLAGEPAFDLGAALPVEALRLVLAEPNSVVAATFSTRDDGQKPWQPVASGTFYRLTREGTESVSPVLEIPRHADRLWRAKVSAGTVPGAAPSLEVQWHPAQLVFVARGDGPFSLRFGDAKAPSVALPVASLIPGYERLAELKLPEATVGAVASAPPPSAWEAFVARIDAKVAALWAVLVAAVAFLGFMAWRIARGGQ